MRVPSTSLHVNGADLIARYLLNRPSSHPDLAKLSPGPDPAIQLSTADVIIQAICERLICEIAAEHCARNEWIST